MRPFNFNGSIKEQCAGLLAEADALKLNEEQRSRLLFLQAENPLGDLYRSDLKLLETLKTRFRKLYHKVGRA